MQSWHRGGLCIEVVFKRWSLIKGFTLVYNKIWLFPFSISTFHVHCFQLPHLKNKWSKTLDLISELFTTQPIVIAKYMSPQVGVSRAMLEFYTAYFCVSVSFDPWRHGNTLISVTNFEISHVRSTFSLWSNYLIHMLG